MKTELSLKKMTVRLARVLLWIVLILAILIAGGCTYQRLSLTRTREQFPRQAN